MGIFQVSKAGYQSDRENYAPRRENRASAIWLDASAIFVTGPPVTPTVNPVPDASGEGDLVARAQSGDTSAFTELVKRYERKIYRLAKNITQNDEDAEDVLQDSFLKAYEHLSGFQGQSKFYTWIVRIAVNEALMKLRKRRGDRFVSLDEPIDTGEEEVKREVAVWEGNPEQQYSQEELQRILNEAVEGLKPDFRTVFTLRDIEELSTEETAEALNISVPAVKSRLLRARLALREKLTRQFKRKGEDVFAYL
jgi:RNA polymerase sigma-70 factor (ECF subfamily)